MSETSDVVVDTNIPVIEMEKAPDPLAEALKDFPKNENMTILVGQHRRYEPLAFAVGEGVVGIKSQQDLPVKKAEFPSGFDYTDYQDIAKAEGKTYSNVYQERDTAAKQLMAKIALENPGQTVVNMHETIDPWEHSDELRIDILLPPRLIPPAQGDVKDLVKDINEKTAGLNISLEGSLMTDLKNPHESNESYNNLGPNMFVIEIHTPSSLYEKIDESISGTEGNHKLKNDPETLQRLEKIKEAYLKALSLLLPVLNAKYTELHLNPKNDMVAHNPDFIKPEVTKSV